MINFKKTETLLIILLLILISGIFLIQNPSTITKLFLIDSRATQQGLSLSITIGGSEEEDINATLIGEVKPTNNMIKAVIPKIANISAGSNIKLRVYTADTPTGFTAPSTTQVAQVFNYINITLNTTLSGTATIYFNITQANLGTTDTDDIRLYRYTTTWNELTTTVTDGTSDPASFSAETDSFSPFLIGKKAAGLPSVTTPLGGGPSKGGIEIPKTEERPKPKPVIKLPEVIKKVIEKVKQIPEILQYEVNYKFLYITTIFIISFIILLEIIYYFKVHKK